MYYLNELHNYKEKRLATIAIWKANNPEKKKELDKARYERTKDPKIEERKQWKLEHPEKVAAEKEQKRVEKNKSSYQKDKENGKCDSIQCDCGGTYRFVSKARHFKTKKHLNFINS